MAVAAITAATYLWNN